ncbi:hypothetical protein [Vulcanisaeta sp. JCM 16159]
MEVKGIKQAIRERIWRLLEERNAASFPRLPGIITGARLCVG